jgi:hypothetical protein
MSEMTYIRIAVSRSKFDELRHIACAGLASVGLPGWLLSTDKLLSLLEQKEFGEWFADVRPNACLVEIANPRNGDPSFTYLFSEKSEAALFRLSFEDARVLEG